ncbi:xylulokinase [Rhizohabitans arisaemae]|uniref:xylulokinase n=1 Tax=Rhizohabitans arisaemae TaxID=2720610 RepID=UPI0024B0DF7A|nr:FGGY family carbohydrate kinase [Rhizohabitans arisaemae]
MERRASGGGALLAVDAGSSRTRVTLLSVNGRTLASRSAPTPSSRDLDGTAVLSGESLWNQVAELVRGLRPREFDVVGIGVAAQLGVVLADESGNAVEDVLLWPDGRAAGHVRELERRLGPYGALLGRPVSAELPACKLMWWAGERPDALGAARWVLSLKDFLVLRLTGAAVTDETHASYTGWFDVAARAYSAELVRRAGVAPALLPPVRSAHEPAGTLSAAAAERLGLAEGTCVAVGGPDGSVGALGAGAVRPGVTVDVAGTTDVLLSVVGEPRWTPPARTVLNAFVLPGHWVLGGPTGMTGGAVDWVSRLLGFGSAADAFDRLGGEAMALPVGCDGVGFNPALSGSRLPTWDSAERGMLSGLGQHHSAAHVFRAAHEGAAFTVLEGIDALRAAGATVDEIVIVGGIAKQPELVRLRSELWGVPVRVLAGEEATTVGAAMLAGIASGLFRDAAHAADALVSPAVTTPRGDAHPADVARARLRWQATADSARVLGSPPPAR